MDWLQLIGILGLGSLISQVVTAFYSHWMTEKSERRRWIRDNKLAAFADLTNELLRFGFDQERDEVTDPLAAHRKVAKALLFMEDESLGSRLHSHFVDQLKLTTLTHQGLRGSEEWTALTEKLLNEMDVLVKDLRTNLLHSDIGTTTGFSAPTQWLIVTGILTLAALIFWVYSIYQ
jgi:hypothetical protein